MNKIIMICEGNEERSFLSSLAEQYISLLEQPILLIDELDIHFHSSKLKQFTKQVKTQSKIRISTKLEFAQLVCRGVRQFIYKVKEKQSGNKRCKYRKFIKDESFKLFDAFVTFITILKKCNKNKSLNRKEMRVVKHTHTHIRKRWYSNIIKKYLFEANSFITTWRIHYESKHKTPWSFSRKTV